MNNSVIGLVNTKPQNKQMHCQISPRNACNPCGYTMKISSRYYRLLIYDEKRITKIDGMGPFIYKFSKTDSNLQGVVLTDILIMFS